MRGVDLGDLYADRMSIRRFRVLVRGLPHDSRTSTVLRRLQEQAGTAKLTPIEELPADVWSTTDYLLATAVDELRITRWVQIARSRAAGTPPPPFPELLPRPGGPPRRRKRINSIFAAFGLPPLEAPIAPLDTAEA